ncbi:MAG: exodeoxyribonuclease VII large subunit, partial [Bdellovibrionales bacterium]
NNEALARKVAEIKTPVISAVGHEIDFTICDFVADLRAPTPSAAAELVVKNTGDLEEKLSKTKLQMIQGIRLQLKYFKEKLVGLDKQVIHPRRLLQDRFQRVDELLSQLVQSTRQTLIREQAQVQKFKEILESLNPKQILQRGFCLALDSKNKIITDSKKLKVKESISLEFFKGGAKALITSKE